MTGEEYEVVSGKKRHSKGEEPFLAKTKKRLLLDNFDMNSYSDSQDRQFVVASPDFLEDRCARTGIHPMETNAEEAVSPGVHSVVIEREEVKAKI